MAPRQVGPLLAAVLMLEGRAGLAAQQLRGCVVEDYVLSVGDCQPDGTQQAVWEVPEGLCEATHRRLEGRVQCACWPEEFFGVYKGTCRVDGTQPFAVSPAVLERCSGPAASLGPAATDGYTLCLCSADDIGTAYTACDAATNTRQVVSFWKKPCEPGPLALPPPREPVSCQLECRVGAHPGPDGECVACGEGETSSASTTYGPPWDETGSLPDAFYTHCADGECADWKLEGGYISSNPGKAQTNLRLWAAVKTVPAYAEITWRITGKVYKTIGDFYIYVDGFYAFGSSYEGEWQTVGIDLINRDLCLWEATFRTAAARRTFCLRHNHVVPYNPLLSLDPTKHASLLNGQALPVEVIEGSPCTFSRQGSGLTFWVAVVNETSFTQDCRWDSALEHLQEAEVSLVVVFTTRELNNEDVAAKSTSLLHTPLVYVRDALDTAEFVSIEDVTLGANPYAQPVTEVSLDYEKLVSADNTSAVQIKKIVVHGTEGAEQRCRACPAGSYSSGGKPCEPCPTGTFAPVPATAACLPCEGGIVTADRQQCVAEQCTRTEADYGEDYGACKWIATTSCDDVEDCTCKFPDSKLKGCHKMRRVVTHYLRGCLNPDDSKRPADKELLCSRCPAGEYMDDLLECRRCPAGSIAKEQPVGVFPSVRDACTACPLGVLPSLVYPGDRDWAPRRDGSLCDEDEACAWVKSCSPGPPALCFVAESTAGGGRQLVQGRGLAKVGEITQTLSVTDTFVPEVGEVTFDFKISGDAADVASGAVRIAFAAYSVDEDELLFEQFNVGADHPGGGNVTAKGLVGRVRVSWSYIKTSATAGDVIFTLAGVRLTGAQGGGASECLETCPSALQCAQGSVPFLCSPGSIAPSSDAPCKPCDEGTWQAGQRECRPCENNLLSSADRTRCAPPPDCKLLLGEDAEEWDLGLLGNRSNFLVIPSQALREQESDSTHFAQRRVALCPTENEPFVWSQAPGKTKPDVLGRVLDKIDVNRTAVMTAMELTFVSGDLCRREDGRISHWRVWIRLVCGVSDEMSAMEELPPKDDCEVRLQYSTSKPCRKCKPSNWWFGEGCPSTYGTDIPCYGVPPYSSDTCTTETSSSSVSVGTVVAIAVIIVLVLVLLALLLFIRARRLDAKYSALTSRRSRSEARRQMGELELTSSVASPQRQSDLDAVYDEDGAM